MKKHTAKDVTFIDVKGKQHVAIVMGKIEGEFIDLKYHEDGNIVIAYEVPKMTERTKRFCWK